MSKRTRQRISTATNAIIAVLIVILLLGVVGFFAFFTNGFTSDFKTFYVNVRGKTIMNDTDGYEIVVEDEYRFDVKYTFGFMQKKNEKLGYHVQIIPNITDETDFDFIVNGQNFKYSDEADLMQGFEITLYDDYFTLEANKDLSEILSDLHLGSPVTGVPSAIDSGINYFTLMIFSEDKSTKIAINFNLVALKIFLSPDHIVF